jgi:hypothetical protein
VAIVLEQPVYIRQTKAQGCWYSCLKMLLLWHTGVRAINDQSVKDKVSHFKPRSYGEIGANFLGQNGLFFLSNKVFDEPGEVESYLKKYGPFMGGGSVGKALGFAGPRIVGHAILIYGITGSDVILHHDPMAGAHSTIKWKSFEKEQYGEVVIRTLNPRIVPTAMSSSS